MNISFISEKLTNGIARDLDLSEEKKELIAYAIETGLLSICGAFLIIIFGYSLNALIPTAVAAVFGGMLRRLSGGAHFNTPLKCLFFGAIMYSSIGVFAKKLIEYGLTNQYVLILILLTSFFLVSFLAPVDCLAKPINSRQFRFKLKIMSILFVIITGVIVFFNSITLINVSAVLGVFYQSITLLPVFNMERR